QNPDYSALPMSLPPRHRERAQPTQITGRSRKGSRNMRRKTMRTMLLAAAAALSVGVGSAYAGEGNDIPNTFFTQLPGVIAQAPAQNVPSVATAQNGQAVHTYVTNSQRGTWLFPPNETGGGNN